MGTITVYPQRLLEELNIKVKVLNTVISTYRVSIRYSVLAVINTVSSPMISLVNACYRLFGN